MIQGWHNEDYFILFEEEEAIAMTKRYGVGEYLPGYTIVGLKGWDDFILRDGARQYFTAPTVPMAHEYLKRFTFNIEPAKLQPDSHVADRIKWYVQPLAFGGVAHSEQNTSWITVEQHIEAVRWWNNKFHELR